MNKGKRLVVEEDCGIGKEDVPLLPFVTNKVTLILVDLL